MYLRLFHWSKDMIDIDVCLYVSVCFCMSVYTLQAASCFCPVMLL